MRVSPKLTEGLQRDPLLIRGAAVRTALQRQPPIECPKLATLLGVFCTFSKKKLGVGVLNQLRSSLSPGPTRLSHSESALADHVLFSGWNKRVGRPRLMLLRCCLLLQDLLQSCSRGGEKDCGGHVL